MSTSIYDPCLFVTNRDVETFRTISMQTEDTLIFGTAVFSSLEERKLEKAQFRSRPKAALTRNV